MATSFKDPIWDKIETGVAKTLGIPAKLIAAIRTKGERSNSDQVSSAGARSVYQIIPATRAAIKAKYGVDAYAGPEQAALAAGHILKENLDRHNGNTAAAVSDYHGGTSAANKGPVNRAYVARVTGEEGGDRPSRSAGSTYDRVTAAQAQDTGPSIAKVYAAYRTGKMDPRDAAQFERDVETGAIMLPRNGSLRKTPAAPTLPAGVVKAYNSHAMSDEDRAQVDADLHDGTVSLPRGAKLKRPDPRTFGENLGMGVRGIAEGAGSLVDTIAGPVNNVIGMTTGANMSMTPFRDVARTAADAVGLATPESDQELLGNAIVEGGTQGALTAGAGAALSGAAGTTGAIARGLAASPVLDTVSGATSGASSEVARQSGAGIVGQLAAGLVGGGVPIAAVEGASRVAARVGRRAGTPLAEIVADVPREALIEPNGKLTDDGAEYATQHGVTPDELRQAYDAPPPDVAVANDAAPSEAVAKAVGDDVAPVQEAAPPVAQEVAPEVAATAPASPEAAPIAAAADNVPETALARVQEGQDLGIDYSRGQATKSFDVQDAESRLRNSNGAEAEQMRQFIAKQQGQVKAAVADLQSAFGDPSLAAADRGVAVKDAVRALRDSGRAGVTRLYEKAAQLGGDGLGLITDDIARTVKDVQIDEAVSPTIKRALDQEMARYGLVGKAEKGAEPVKPNELGITKVALDDGSTVSFRGDVEPLTVANAEKLRQSMNRLWKQDETGALSPVKNAIDDAVEEALESAATRGDQAGPVGEAYRAARAAHVEQKQTFANKDVVEQTIAWKKGTRNSEAINPEDVFKKIFAGGKDGVTNLRKMKAVLLSKRTPKSEAAWRGIQAHGLATIFDKATTRTTNAAGEITDAVSGAKLRSSIEAFGVDKLKVLLEPEEFNRLLKLRRVIEDVTVPIAGTTNPSGSGNLIMRLLKDADNQFTAAASAAGFAVGGPAGAAIAGGAARMVSPAIKEARVAKQAAETAEGVTSYTPERAAIDDAQGTKPASTASKAASAVKGAASSSVRAFIDTYGSPRVIAPILASAQGVQE